VCYLYFRKTKYGNDFWSRVIYQNIILAGRNCSEWFYTVIAILQAASQSTQLDQYLIQRCCIF